MSSRNPEQRPRDPSPLLASRVILQREARSPAMFGLSSATPTSDAVSDETDSAAPYGWWPIEMLLAVIAIIALAPVLVMIAFVVFVQDGGNPIFVQRRIGHGGKLFPCLKFRSMVTDSKEQLEALLASDPDAEREWARDQKLRHDPRITPLGNWLRKTSLDELPQLFNIVAGHMSVVGPRPIVPSEVSRYGRYFQHYCSVRPGLTGLWQVSGRSSLSYRRRVVIDTVYVRTRTLTLDLIIVVRTVPAMLLRRGSV